MLIDELPAINKEITPDFTFETYLTFCGPTAPTAVGSLFPWYIYMYVYKRKNSRGAFIFFLFAKSKGRYMVYVKRTTTPRLPTGSCAVLDDAK